MSTRYGARAMLQGLVPAQAVPETPRSTEGSSPSIEEMRQRIMASFDGVTTPRSQGGLGVRPEFGEEYGSVGELVSDVRKNKRLVMPMESSMPSGVGAGQEQHPGSLTTHSKAAAKALDSEPLEKTGDFGVDKQLFQRSKKTYSRGQRSPVSRRARTTRNY